MFIYICNYYPPFSPTQCHEENLKHMNNLFGGETVENKIWTQTNRRQAERVLVQQNLYALWDCLSHFCRDWMRKLNPVVKKQLKGDMTWQMAEKQRVLVIYHLSLICCTSHLSFMHVLRDGESWLLAKKKQLKSDPDLTNRGQAACTCAAKVAPW